MYAFGATDEHVKKWLKAEDITIFKPPVTFNRKLLCEFDFPPSINVKWNYACSYRIMGRSKEEVIYTLQKFSALFESPAQGFKHTLTLPTFSALMQLDTFGQWTTTTKYDQLPALCIPVFSSYISIHFFLVS